MLNNRNNVFGKSCGLLILSLLVLLMAACSQSAYEESFATPGNWSVGDDGVASGKVEDGVYKLSVSQDSATFWATAGEEFKNGLYSVEATQVGGPIDAGYGMLIRVDNEADSFYKFAITSDGYARVDRCLSQCAEEVTLVENWWFETDTIIQGMNETNVLSVEANGGNLIFRINELEIGRVTDSILSEGDIGVFIETLGIGGVTVDFDNYKVLPLE